MAVMEKPSDAGVAGLTVAIVGLGLMGGSVARALRRGTGAAVWAVDSDDGLINRALNEGVIDRGDTAAGVIVSGADLIVVCLYPEDSVRFIAEHMQYFKPGAVVTDICGVKCPVVDGVLPYLRDDVDFVPGHPMAGREKAGYACSVETLFDRCNYILTPHERNTERGLELVSRFAGALGAGRVVLSTPDEHDEMIAYTSQLPHALAVAYVLAAGERDPLPFSAGSFRDVSRVAAINARMWSELFAENADALASEIEALSAGLGRVAAFVRSGDRAGLAGMMAAAAALKEGRL